MAFPKSSSVHSQKKMLKWCGLSTYTEILAFSTLTWGGVSLSYLMQFTSGPWMLNQPMILRQPIQQNKSMLRWLYFRENVSFLHFDKGVAAVNEEYTLDRWQSRKNVNRKFSFFLSAPLHPNTSWQVKLMLIDLLFSFANGFPVPYTENIDDSNFSQYCHEPDNPLG